MCVRFVITRVPQSTCPSYRSGGNWVCFARFAPSMGVGRCCPAWPGIGLFRLGRGQLGSFGAIGPSDGSAGAFAGPCPSLSVPANWLRLYNRAQRRLRRRPRPSAPAPVAAGRIGFVSHAFVRSTAFTRIGPVFPASRRYSERSRSPLGSLCLWGKSSTRKHAGPLTTKPSKVVVSYLSSAILLLCYHTGVTDSSSNEIMVELSNVQLLLPSFSSRICVTNPHQLKSVFR